MANRIAPQLQAWIEARKRHGLSHAQVQMARELGLDPKKLGGIDNHRSEPWKVPLPELIEATYLERFGRLPAQPVRSIEELAANQRAEKIARSEARKAVPETESSAKAPPSVAARYPDRKISETILEFGDPLLEMLPPDPPIEVFRNMMTIIIMVWNLGSMTFPIWRKQASTDHHAQWEAMMKQAPPETRLLFEELLRRRASAPYREDQRGVGEWSVRPDGNGGFHFRCDARLPHEPTDSE